MRPSLWVFLADDAQRLVAVGSEDEVRRLGRLALQAADLEPYALAVFSAEEFQRERKGPLSYVLGEPVGDGRMLLEIALVEDPALMRWASSLVSRLLAGDDLPPDAEQGVAASVLPLDPFERLLGTGEVQDFPGPGEGGVDQLAADPPGVLGVYGEDHRLGLAALSAVHRDRVAEAEDGELVGRDPDLLTPLEEDENPLA